MIYDASLILINAEAYLRYNELRVMVLVYRRKGSPVSMNVRRGEKSNSVSYIDSVRLPIKDCHPVRDGTRQAHRRPYGTTLHTLIQPYGIVGTYINHSRRSKLGSQMRRIAAQIKDKSSCP